MCVEHKPTRSLLNMILQQAALSIPAEWRCVHARLLSSTYYSVQTTARLFICLSGFIHTSADSQCNTDPHKQHQTITETRQAFCSGVSSIRRTGRSRPVPPRSFGCRICSQIRQLGSFRNIKSSGWRQMRTWRR